MLSAAAHLSHTTPPLAVLSRSIAQGLSSSSSVSGGLWSLASAWGSQNQNCLPWAPCPLLQYERTSFLAELSGLSDLRGQANSEGQGYSSGEVAAAGDLDPAPSSLEGSIGSSWISSAGRTLCKCSCAWNSSSAHHGGPL